MTDDWAQGDTEFDDAFFTALEAGPDEDPASGDELDLDLEGDGGVDEFLYEAEGDGSFETNAVETEAVETETEANPYFDFDGE
jgi:hypothetical protein